MIEREDISEDRENIDLNTVGETHARTVSVPTLRMTLRPNTVSR